MIKDIHYYRSKFSKLKVSRSAGVAPNQPVLLLAVIELIQRGKIQLDIHPHRERAVIPQN